MSNTNHFFFNNIIVETDKDFTDSEEDSDDKETHMTDDYDEETELDFVEVAKPSLFQKLTFWLKSLFSKLKK